MRYASDNVISANEMLTSQVMISDDTIDSY